jgi:hypothetical protein
MKRLLLLVFLHPPLALPGQVPSPGASDPVSALPRQVYASVLLGSKGDAIVAPGSTATGTDRAAAFNLALSGGNVNLVVDGQYGLSTSLVLHSNTAVSCLPGMGFIMQPASNAPVLTNAHHNAPTIDSGTGGYLVSNIADHNIKVEGCTLNANSLQAVTGGNMFSVQHTVNPNTGIFVVGVHFVGVDNLLFDHNEVYDSGTFAAFFSNVTYARVTNNYVHQPKPLTAFKFTDGLHFIGPDSFLWIQNNRVNAGDDSIALNADDGNRTGSGDPNYANSQFPGVRWGWITDAHIDNNTLDYAFFGLRLYSATELIDRVSVTNTSGTVCGTTASLQSLAHLGRGNFGKIDINGWTLQTDGTCDSYKLPYNFLVSSDFVNLQISNVSIANPGVNWPVYTQTRGTGGILSLRNWDLTTLTTTFSSVVALNGGTVVQLAVSGMNWYDAPGNTGSFFSGPVVPSVLTCSNYAGPKRLFASGYSPPIKSGDCFTIEEKTR